MNDNKPLTKNDLNILKEDIVYTLKIDIEKGQARYFGLISNHFDDKFETIKDAILGNTERLDRIEQKFEENETEHKSLRMRIGTLERK